ncbi:MAG TPA: ribonuclease E inhibitor RraB [Pirellulales bacterium]|nr:ribonuclease E inhibitor RraB [Pirellulales bacterium]
MADPVHQNPNLILSVGATVARLRYLKLRKGKTVIAVMGFLSFLFGGCGNSGSFVTKQAFEKNLATQVALAPQTLQELRKHGVTDETRLKLEFFFYTDTEPKAVRLDRALKELGYSVEFRPSAGDRKQLVITGWTDKMAMDEASVVDWTRRMCQLGFDCDCEFDGWGTNPVQD